MMNLVYSASFEMEYDEDLTKNPFLMFFTEHYGDLYEKAVKDQLLVCVPAATSLCEDSFDEHYVRQHLILTSEEQSRTLANDNVQMKDGSITCGTISSKILFRETLYTKSGKLNVVCIHQEEYFNNSLSRTPTMAQKRLIMNSMKTVKTSIQTYKKRDPEFSDSEILAACLDEIKAKLNSQDKKTANCVIYNLYPQIMELVLIQNSSEDSSLNRVRRNHSDLKPRDLKLPEEFITSLSKALAVLEELPGKKLASDKIECVKTTIKQLAENDISSELNADKLLSLLTFLILKSQANSWAAQLEFIRTFNYFDPCGEESYLLSTLEAAIHHLKQGELTFCSDNSLPNDPLFRMAKTGDAEGLLELLNGASFECHPLCGCNACGLPIEVNSSTRDSKGFTPLHYTCMHGHTEATQTLLKGTASDVTNLRDARGRTALHWAAAKGHQTCLLLVCHQAGCDLNAVDFQGNTPLHLAVQNSNESCVKALLYYSEHAHLKLLSDAVNEDGETPLHLAAKWGYASIVRLLLEWEANTRVLNKKKLSASDVAQNLRIKIMLEQAQSEVNVSRQSNTKKIWNGIARQLSLRRAKPQPA